MTLSVEQREFLFSHLPEAICSTSLSDLKRDWEDGHEHSLSSFLADRLDVSRETVFRSIRLDVSERLGLMSLSRVPDPPKEFKKKDKYAKLLKGIVYGSESGLRLSLVARSVPSLGTVELVNLLNTPRQKYAFQKVGGPPALLFRTPRGLAALAEGRILTPAQAHSDLGLHILHFEKFEHAARLWDSELMNIQLEGKSVCAAFDKNGAELQSDVLIHGLLRVREDFFIDLGAPASASVHQLTLGKYTGTWVATIKTRGGLTEKVKVAV